MRPLSGPIWDLWSAGGPFLGTNKAHGRVTVEFGWVLRESIGPVGDRPASKLPIRWFQRADNSQVETELPNCKNLHISRSVDTDAGSFTLSVYNTQMLPAQLLELGNPGYFTPYRGSHPDATTRWGHAANEWSVEMTPNALVRTYEGYGGYNPDGTKMSIEDCLAAGYLVQTGCFLIDSITPDSDANLAIEGRDAAKLLIEQPIYPPLVPAGLYPVQYARFYYRHVETPYIAYGTAAGGVKIIVGIIADAGNDGYWLYGDDGGVFTYGDNYFHGSLSGDLDHQGIGMARSHLKEGYWLAVKAGDVYSFGDATWLGGHAPAVGEEMVAIESPAAVDGYYLCDTAGHVYSFGAAVYHGGSPATSGRPIVGMAVRPDGGGYWLVDDLGHVFAYGSAPYLGNADPSVGSPYTAIESSPTGDGYYVATKKGHVYAFGDAVYHGSTMDIAPGSGTSIALTLNDPISDITIRPDGNGYWLVAEDGGVFTFGPIGFYGSLPGMSINDFPYDGNYFDYVDIVKDLLLWSGFWLYDGGAAPNVYGNLESTGIYGLDLLPAEMFDQKKPMEVINQIKEIVGYITWVDEEGGFHFESPNWWSEGNFMWDGSRTNVLPEIDERVQLISYAVQIDDKAARDRVIIMNADPVDQIPGTLVTTVIPLTSPMLRGMLSPAMWTNAVMATQAQQDTMARLLGQQLMFRQRLGSVSAWALPLIGVNDQARIWERITDEVYDHYIRTYETDHDFDTGEYTMKLTTHWLGRDWSGPGPTRNILIGGVHTGLAFGGFTVLGGSYPVAIGSVIPDEGVGVPHAAFPQTILAAAPVPDEAIGIPTVVGPRTFTMSASSSSETAGQPTVVFAQSLLLAAVASAEAFGLPLVSLASAPGASAPMSAGLGTTVLGSRSLGGS